MARTIAPADGGELADELRNFANAIQIEETRSATGPGWTPGWDGAQSAAGDHQAPPTAAAADGTQSLYIPARPRILLVGDKGFTSLLKYILEGNGFDCILTDTLADAIVAAAVEQPSLIALDDMACGDRVDLALERLHQNPATCHVPTLIMASVWPQLQEGCVHAEQTAYIMKPFLPDIFIDRLHGLMRASAPPSTKVLRFSDIVMESDAHRVSRGARCIRLCPVEYRILRHLLECPRRVFSREQILASIRAHTQDNAVRSIDVHISRIRKALCEHGEPNYIRTVRGLGYSLDVAPDGPAAYVPRPDLGHDARKPHRSDAVSTARG